MGKSKYIFLKNHHEGMVKDRMTTLGDIQNVSGQGPEQPDLGWPS